MGFADAGQREARGDAGPDAALADQFEDSQHVVHARAAHAEQVQFQPDQIGRGERHRLAALLAADDDAAAQPHHAAQKTQQIGTAGIVDGVIEAVATGQRQHFGAGALGIGGDDGGVGAELTQDRGLRRVARGRDHARAGKLAKLQRCLTHAAGGSGD